MAACAVHVHTQGLGASLSSDAEAPLTNRRWPLVLYTFIFKVGCLASRRRGAPLTSPKWSGEQPPRLQKIGNDGEISVDREGVMRARLQLHHRCAAFTVFVKVISPSYAFTASAGFTVLNS